MDNTDVKRKVVLVRKTYNHLTGERTTTVKPKLVKSKKIIVARGYRSMGGDAGHTVGDVLTAKALPFRFAMRTLLNQRGYNTNKLKFKSLLIKFYNEFSSKKYIDESNFVNNVVFKLRPTDNPSGDINDARNRTAFFEVTQITNDVINIFKIARDKYMIAANNGLQPEQLLKDEELTMAKATFKVERSLLSENKKDHYVSSGELHKTLYFIGGFLLIYWLISTL